MKKILAFSGSNSSKSINQQLVHILAKYVSKAAIEVISLRDYEAPVYGMDAEQNDGFPASMEALHEKIGEADGFIVSSPEHNGSMPAVLKSTIDWQSRMGRKVFNNKPTLFTSTSPGGRGGLTALSHLLAIMPHQGAQVIGGHALGSFNDKVVDGDLVAGEDKDTLLALIEQLEAAL